MKDLNTVDGMDTVEATQNTAPDNTTENTENTESTAAAAEPTENPTTTETTQIIENIEISNVFKSALENNQKRDKRSLDVVLVRYETERGSKTIIYYKADDSKKQVEGLDANIGDILPDGGLVVSVGKGQVKRKYATLRISLDDLADKIAALDESAWQPRTKTRPSAKSEL